MEFANSALPSVFEDLQAQGLTTLLRTQPSLGVDKKGALFYACDGVSGAPGVLPEGHRSGARPALAPARRRWRAEPQAGLQLITPQASRVLSVLLMWMTITWPLTLEAISPPMVQAMFAGALAGRV